MTDDIKTIRLTKTEYDALMKAKYEEGYHNGYNDARCDTYDR